MEIDFADTVMPKVAALGAASFQAVVDGEYLWCDISCEALRDHFGALSMIGNDFLLAFHAGRGRVEQAA